LANPIFLHVTSTGGVWVSISPTFTPPSGTVLSTHKINSGTSNQRIGTITATGAAVTSVSGGTGVNGKEIS
jgi:hypothetical protein